MEQKWKERYLFFLISASFNICSCYIFHTSFQILLSNFCLMNIQIVKNLFPPHLYSDGFFLFFFMVWVFSFKIENSF